MFVGRFFCRVSTTRDFSDIFTNFNSTFAFKYNCDNPIYKHNQANWCFLSSASQPGLYYGSTQIIVKGYIEAAEWNRLKQEEGKSLIDIQ